ncbi:MAG: molybdate ABC transporter substrate-binding protein [Alphaproteobacteria bacterium]|nr:molybdate ABC transporter substrate-binding protein [Alphaproteobacteria bacterium]
MRQRRVFIALLAPLLAGLCVIASAPARAEVAMVAVASNFTAPLAQIAAAFEAASGHEVRIVTGSTGKLYAQIANGAPVDVFLAADDATPRRLVDDGLAAAAPFTYAIGQIVLWDPAGGPVGPERLGNTRFRRLAIANARLAPYGRAAEEVIASLGAKEALADKLVRGENIGQTFAFVQSGNAELGFVALSQVLALPAANRGAYWSPPADAHAPIRQDGLALRRSDGNPAATAFLAFLKTDAARRIIQTHGYDQE